MQKIVISYANKLFNAHLIYYHFSNHKIKNVFINKKFSSLALETYSMLSRSLALGCIDSGNNSIIKTQYKDIDNDSSNNNIFRKKFKKFNLQKL